MKRFSSRLRASFSGLRKRLQGNNREERSTENTPQESNVERIKKSSVDSWSKQSRFRSKQQLGGSSMIYIWFESLQEIGVRFSLDMETGILSNREHWEPGIEMPGADAIDPEPLSVWGIDSADGRINIIMHVDRFDDLLVDGVSADIDSYPDIQGVLREITNVLVRDIWIEPPS